MQVYFLLQLEVYQELIYATNNTKIQPLNSYSSIIGMA